MTDEPDDEFTPPAPRSRLRRLRKAVLWVFGVVAVVLFVAVVARWQAGRAGQRRLDAVTQQLDATDPEWRLDAVIAAHNARAPAKDNAAPEAADLADRIPKEFRDWQHTAVAGRWAPGGVSNHLPPPDAVESARGVAGVTLLVRTDALKLRDRRGGATYIDLTADPLMLTLPHLDKARQVAALLQYDGKLAAVEKNPNRGVSAARAALGVARSVGDEPLYVSQFVRMACAGVGARTAMQVLAWGEPTEGLAELQAELLAEADVPWFRVAMRGHRAFHDRVFAALEDGSLTPEALFRHFDVPEPGPHHYAAFRAYQALLPGDRAKCLDLCTEYLEASKLPPHEQLPALKRVAPVTGRDRYTNLGTRHLLQACEQLARAGLRARAELLAAACCVACERFRLKEGRWPREPAELVPAYLSAVPLNPFDGTPIGFRALGDRVVVYSYWADCPMESGTEPNDFRPPGSPSGMGYGYRVWSPSARGLPAKAGKTEP